MPTIWSCCCHIPAAGRTGQGAAGRVAGAQGSGLQRGQDANRAPRRGVRLSWGSTSAATNAQAADQAEQGGRQADPETARDRDARPARLERDGGHRRAQPDHPGVGRLLPGVVSSKVFSALDDYLWRLTYKWAKTQPSEQVEDVDRRPVLRQVQQVQERPVGVRRPRPHTTAAHPYLLKFSWTNIVRHQMVTGAASPDDPALTDYWAAPAEEGQGPAGQLQRCACSPSRTGGARYAGTTCSSPTSHPSPPRVGTLVAEHHPQGDSRRLSHPPRTARRTGRRPNPPRTRLLPPRAPRPQPQEHSTPPARPRGLLEPCAGRIPHARF